MLGLVGCSSNDGFAPPNNGNPTPTNNNGTPVVLELPEALGGQTETTYLASSAVPTLTQNLNVLLPASGPTPPVPASNPPTAPPPSVDISKWAPQPGYQGQYGDCACWASGYSALGWWANKTGIGGQPFNPVFIYSQVMASHHQQCNAANGTYIDDDMKLLLNVGNDPFTVYPNTTCATPSSSQIADAAPYKIGAFHDVAWLGSKEDTIKAALAAGEPAVIGFSVYNEFENAGSGSYFIDAPGSGSSYLGAHAVAVMKYDDHGVWVLNSWGTSWGRSGWAELSWAFVNGTDKKHGDYVFQVAQIDGMASKGDSGPGRYEQPWPSLNTIASGCGNDGAAMGPACASAYSRYCQGRGVTSGFGPISKTTSVADMTCLFGSMHQAHFSDWTSSIPACDGTSDASTESSTCSSAVHRWCRNAGYETGFGPVEHQGDNASVVCLSSAEGKAMQSTYSALQTYHPVCNGSTERWGGDCMFAIDKWCQATQGAKSGYGPVENSGDNVTVVCTY